MASLDKVKGDYKLYISGFFSLRRKEQLRLSEISHVLSILRMPMDRKLLDPYKHFQVEVDDLENENLLEHFATTNRFIKDGLSEGGGVLVHCVMGKSRSATCIIAFLMQTQRITPIEALQQLQMIRPMCEPNDGFMKQLELYHRMDMIDKIEAHPIYQRWVYERNVQDSIATGIPPELEYIVFEDEGTGTDTLAKGNGAGSERAYDLRCRKCRRIVASSKFISQHQRSKEIFQSNTNTSLSTSFGTKPSSSPSPSSSSCAHIFVDPLSWMRPELEKSHLAGRLECPGERCKVVVGRYAWHGQKCSCGAWVVPAFALAKDKVDEVRKTANQAGARDVAALNIRMPPSREERQ